MVTVHTKTADKYAELTSLFRAGLAGDAASYNRFLQAVAPILRRAVARKLSQSDVEDVVQEILISIHKPTQRLTILFEEMSEFFKDKECYGCPFINAAGEYTDRDSPVRKICEAHYQFIITHLEQFARDAKLKSPRLVAEQIASVIAGCYTGWFVANIKDSAKQGKAIAEMVIEAHQP